MLDNRLGTDIMFVFVENNNPMNSSFVEVTAANGDDLGGIIVQGLHIPYAVS